MHQLSACECKVMTSYCVLLVLVLAVGLQDHIVSPWSFSPLSEPLQPTVDPAGDVTFTVMCLADTPLVTCQFDMFPPDNLSYPLIDLSRGSNAGVISRQHPLADNVTIFEVSYNGTGLEYGQCGATFNKLQFVSYHFGCRGSDKDGVWHDLDFAIINPRHVRLNITIKPRQVVVEPGSNVSILLTTPTVLRLCLVKFADQSAKPYVVIEGASKPFTDHFRYHGRSPSRGECGISLTNITEQDNGPMMFLGLAYNVSKVASSLSTLIVASPPTETYFNVDKLKYSEGDTLTATCSSLLSRPVANLTWTLDDRIIRQDGIDDEFQEDVWSWPWDKKNITQRLTIKLKETHFGKKLGCSVQHLALTNHESDFNYLITNV